MRLQSIVPCFIVGQAELGWHQRFVGHRRGGRRLGLGGRSERVEARPQFGVVGGLFLTVEQADAGPGKLA